MSPARVLLLLWGCALAAAPPPARPYGPDLGRWRLELDAPPGGWLSEPGQTVRFKLVDPGDPAPPREGPDAYDPYEDAERYRPPAPQPEPTPAQLRERERRAEAERKANLWRSRTVQVWLNGAASLCQVQVNVTATVPVASQNGENRLELFEPDSGARASCSWWVSTARVRLRIEALQDFRGWSPPGSLQVLEPDGTLAEPGRTTPSGGRLSWRDDYSHAAPPPGAYAVRWKPSPYGEPAVVTVVVTLDPGTDQERRWRLIRLILPGSPPTLLGTFDVEP